MRKRAPTDIPVAPLSRDCASEGAQNAKNHLTGHRPPGPSPAAAARFRIPAWARGPGPGLGR